MSDLIEILYDHPDFVVVDKPANISVQNESNQSGILPLLCHQLNIDKLWLVHRLDKVTSGMLILAKHSEAAATFGKLFERRQIEKYYLAISVKKPKKKQGSIKGGMKKVRDGKWILDNTDISTAVSQFFSWSIGSGVRLFLVKPLTGKTHQIRVALKSLGSPILGDELYKGNISDRTYLHAYSLRFAYKGENISLCCQPSLGNAFMTSETTKQLESLKTPWTLDWPKYKLAKVQ